MIWAFIAGACVLFLGVVLGWAIAKSTYTDILNPKE